MQLLLLRPQPFLTCIISSRQLKMYFLASFDLMPISASCSAGVCRRRSTVGSQWGGLVGVGRSWGAGGTHSLTLSLQRG